MEVVKYSDQGFLEALPNVSKGRLPYGDSGTPYSGHKGLELQEEYIFELL